MKAFTALRRRGIRIPEDCSFLGIDVPSGVHELSGITEIVCPGKRLGYEAADFLARRIKGEFPEPTGVLVPPELAERGSVAAI